MNKQDVINTAISKFNDEYSKLKIMNASDKIKLSNEIAIKVILETVLNFK